MGMLGDFFRTLWFIIKNPDRCSEWACGHHWADHGIDGCRVEDCNCSAPD